MNIETNMDEARLQRYQQASEWLVCLKSTNPSESEIERWLTWCEEDDRNLIAFEELNRDWHELGGLRAMPELIRAAEDDEAGGSRMRDVASAGSVIWRSAIAAAILIILVVGFRLWNRTAEAPHLITSANLKPVVLSDGSSLVLSARAATEVDFTGPDRDLRLRSEGEVYIQVHHDKARPFIVQAGTVTVTAIGTAFDVRREGDHVTVTVEEGTIRVVAPGSNGTLQWQASAGSQIDYSEREQTALVASIDAQRVLQWRRGELSYDRTPLATVISDINRYSTTRIVISDPELEHMVFSGTVFVASIGDWLTAFEAIYPVRASEPSAGTIRLFAAHDRERSISSPQD